MTSATIEQKILVPALIAVAVMCGALMDEDSLGEALLGRGWDLDWPYGYYIFLRFVVCIASIWIAVNGYKWEREWVPWVFGTQAVLYNPIFRVHLNVEAWTVLNLVSITFFIVAIFAVRHRGQS